MGKPFNIHTQARSEFNLAAVFMVARSAPLIEMEPMEADDAAHAEIEADFRRRLVGLRACRGTSEPGAAGREEWAARRAEPRCAKKRARDRLARYTLWRQRLLASRGPERT